MIDYIYICKESKKIVYMKRIEAYKAYKLLQESRLTKMQDSDKFLVIKAMRELRPLSEEYEKDEKEGLEALKDEGFESMQEKAAKHEEALREGNKEGLLPLEELNEVNAFFREYQKNVKKLLEDIQNKECEFSYKRISEDAFGKFVASNDLKGEEIVTLYDALV